MFTTYRKFPSRILEITFKRDEESVLPESPAVVMKPMAVVNNLISFNFFNSWVKKDSENHYSFSSTNGLWSEMEIQENPKGFEIKIRIDPEDGIFGFGEEVGTLNKRGKVYEMYNTDEPDHSPTKTRLYSSFPVFMILTPKKSLGFFLDHPGYSRFDLAFTKENEIIIDIEGEGFKLYLQGTTPDEIVKAFTDLTGKPHFFPVWMLGYQQSRWSYPTEETVADLAEKFREKEIPCDVLYLDIDYMEDFKVFTWNRRSFPNPKRMLENLGKQGFKVITIIDPGVKVQKGYEIYEQGIKGDYFCKKPDGSLFVPHVWPGPSHFPDFMNSKVRKWWGKLCSDFTKTGISGIWNDMNEPSIFMTAESLHELKTIVNNIKEDMGIEAGFILSQLDGQKRYRDYGREFQHIDDSGKKFLNRQVHNIFGFNMSRATYEGLQKHNPDKRPVVITRSAYPGIQRYAILWTGDNASLWEHLLMEIQMAQSLALVGVNFTGCDVGGFGGNSYGELLVRWTQFGVFLPFFRNHSAIGTRNQEPWVFGEEVEEIVRRYIELRYSLMPYIYSILRTATETGIPMVRPLLLEWPDNPQTYETDDEYLFGPALLVAPIYRPNVRGRYVYLPEGKWMDFFDGTIWNGGHAYIEAPLDKIPLFIRENSLIPTTEVNQYLPNAVWKTIKIKGFVTSAASFELYEDDGTTKKYLDGKFSLKKVEIWKSGDKYLARIYPQEGNLELPARKLVLEISDGKKLWKGEIEDSREGLCIELQ